MATEFRWRPQDNERLEVLAGCKHGQGAPAPTWADCRESNGDCFSWKIGELTIYQNYQVHGLHRNGQLAFNLHHYNS